MSAGPGQRRRRRGQRRLTAAGLVLLAWLVAACGSPALLSRVSVSPALFHPDGSSLDDSVYISYQIGRPALVSVSLTDQAGRQFPLRQDEQRTAKSYTLRFNGAVDAGDDRVVLPDGTYRYTVEARAADGESQRAEGSFAIAGADTRRPAVEELVVHPTAITPNFDAIDDVAAITFRTTKAARVTIYLIDGAGERYLIRPPRDETAGEISALFNGRTVEDRALPNADYQVEVVAADRAGNIARVRQPLRIADAGTPVAEIEEVRFEPASLMLGMPLRVRITVRNSGPVTLRTQGPDPGFTYTTNQTFSSVQDGAFTERAGLWRVGIDWDANASGGPRRYPFRWGFGHDLAPGEETTVEGFIQVLQRETEMSFFAGLVQEGIGFPVDQVGRQLVRVGF